jgi:hypothetical protein
VSLHADSNLIARATQVSQSHRDCRSWFNPGRHTDVYLVQNWESRNVTKEQDLRHPSANGDLRRNRTPIRQAGAINFQGFSSNGRVAG